MTETLSMHSEHPGPPRRVRFKRRSLFPGMGCMGLFLLPFILVGIGATALLLGNLYLHFAGQTTTGKILSRYTGTDSDGDTTYHMEYTYQAGDQFYHRNEGISQSAYEHTEIGAPVTIRYAPLLPGIAAATVLPGHSPLTQAGFLALFSAVWDGIVFVFVWCFFIAPLRTRRLFQYGLEGAAVIQKKEMSDSDDSTTYTLHYAFQPETLLSRKIEGKVTVRKQEWEQVRTGETIAVLYDPRNPRHNVLYPFGVYEVVSF